MRSLLDGTSYEKIDNRRRLSVIKDSSSNNNLGELSDREYYLAVGQIIGN